MSKKPSAAAMAVKATTAETKPLPAVIELDEAEKISLSYLVERMKELQNQLNLLQASQAKILAKIESVNGLESGVLAREYQFNGKELFKP